jgi:hypothetical protein
MAFFAAAPNSATVRRTSFLLIGRGTAVGFFPEGVTLSCSGFTLDADIGEAPLQKSWCDIAPVCQSCAYINPPFWWTASLSGGATAGSESLKQLNTGSVEPRPWRPSSVIRPRKIPFIPLFWELDTSNEGVRFHPLAATKNLSSALLHLRQYLSFLRLNSDQEFAGFWFPTKRRAHVRQI